MGTSVSVSKFVTKIEHLGTATERNQLKILNRGALTAKNIILSQAASQGMPANAKLAGKPWGVKYKIVPGIGGAAPTAEIGFRGPFHLVERDTKPHLIGVRKRARRGQNKKKALSFNGVTVATADHPGTKGKGIFANAQKTIRVVVPKVMAGEVVTAWRAVMK
jgi:hypothetical protein